MSKKPKFDLLEWLALHSALILIVLFIVMLLFLWVIQ